MIVVLLLSTVEGFAFESLVLDGTPVEGRIETSTEWIPPGEGRSDLAFNRQVYTFDVQAGETVDLWVTAEFDAFIVLYREDGARIADRDDFSSQFDSRIAVNLEVAGRYFFIVTSYMPERTGDFTLVAQSLGIGAPLPSDYVEAPRARLGWPDLELWTAEPIEGLEQTGELSPEDRAPLPEPAASEASDTARVAHTLAGHAGTMVSLDLTAEFDAILYLVSPEGVLLAWNDEYARVSHARLVDVVLPETGDYQIVVGTSPLGVGTGRYDLTISEARPAPPFSPDRPIAIGDAIESQLTDEDRAQLVGVADRVGLEFYREVFAFDAEANQRVEISVESDFGAYIYTLELDNSTLDAGGDYSRQGHLQASLLAPRTGRYRLVVTSAHPRDGGTYRLSLSQGEPDPPTD